MRFIPFKMFSGHKGPLIVGALLLSFCWMAACGGATTNSTIAFFQERPNSGDDVIVYVYRVPDFVGSAGSWTVYLDGTAIGELRQNAYMALHVKAGNHTIKIGDGPPLNQGRLVETAPDNPEVFLARPGRTYYIRAKGVDVAYLPETEAMGELRTMKYDMGK